MNRRETGSRYEEITAKLLENQGFEILERNYRCRKGEIDLIAKESGYLVFIEVKYRRNSRKGFAAEAITEAKQKRICRVADDYLMRHGIFPDTGIRFDVAAIDGERLHILKNAFPYCGAVRF